MTTKRPSAGPPPTEPAQAPESRKSDLPRQTLPAIAPDIAISERPAVVRLASGHSVAVVHAGAEERVEVRASTGELVVALRLTEDGPVFSLSGASFEIAGAKKVSLSADTIHMKARRDLTVEAGSTLRASGRDVEVQAHPGQVAITANDDVDITGERVRLNSDDPPMPQTWEEHRARHALPGDPFSASTPISHAELSTSPVTPPPVSPPLDSEGKG
ncbi:MAG: hypothetical protein R3B70_17590 [Polyangiaceae bacterium]